MSSYGPMGFGSLLEFRSCLYCLSEWPWESHFITLSLSFLLCKMGIRIIPSHGLSWRSNVSLLHCLIHRQHYINVNNISYCYFFLLECGSGNTRSLRFIAKIGWYHKEEAQCLARRRNSVNVVPSLPNPTPKILQLLPILSSFFPRQLYLPAHMIPFGECSVKTLQGRHVSQGEVLKPCTHAFWTMHVGG